MNTRLAVVSLPLWIVALTGFTGTSLNQDQTGKEAIQDAVVNFGPVHPQPEPPGRHALVPDEVTIFKGGTVTFIMNGTGHGLAIYPVSKDTTRAHIAEDLCQGGPALCNTTA